MTTEASDLFYAIHHTRAMRRLKPDPIPDDVLMKLLDAANQGPTGSNKQNARWIVVRDPAQKQKLADLNRTAVNAYVGNPDDIAPDMRGIVNAVMWQRDHFHEIPALLIPCLKFDQPPTGTWAAGAGAGGSIWPAVQNLLLAARALGLGAALTTLGLSDRPAAKAVLGLPDTVEPFAIIPVGYPTGNFGSVTRKPLEEIVHYDRW
ncbi:MAG: nitroreductase family protein [Chloroflexi bacterium]|nr:nitroreductase family protein [Chloroflexota bacterium]